MGAMRKTCLLRAAAASAVASILLFSAAGCGNQKKTVPSAGENPQTLKPQPDAAGASAQPSKGDDAAGEPPAPKQTLPTTSSIQALALQTEAYAKALQQVVEERATAA